MRLLAHIISAVFQPLLMPSLVVYTLLYHVENSTPLTEGGQSRVLMLVFLTTCLIPVLIVLGFYHFKLIKDIQMTDRKDRRFPFMFVSIFYVVVTYLFHQQPVLERSPLLLLALLAMTAVVLLTNLITYFWKISAHSAGVVGWLAFIMVFAKTNPGNNTLLYPLMAAILLSGVVIWARLYLNAHKPVEIVGGALLGFVICYGAIYYGSIYYV